MGANSKIARPKWLKILINVFWGWLIFVLSIALLLIILWVFQTNLFDFEIEGNIAMTILIIQTLVSGFVAFKSIKWQSKILDTKSLNTNYIVLVVLVLLSFFMIPATMTYNIF